MRRQPAKDLIILESNAQCRICAASLTKPTSMACSISAAYATGDCGHEHGCATTPIAPRRFHPPAPTASVHDNTLDDEQVTKICQIICRKHEIYGTSLLSYSIAQNPQFVPMMILAQVQTKRSCSSDADCWKGRIWRICGLLHYAQVASWHYNDVDITFEMRYSRRTTGRPAL